MTRRPFSLRARVAAATALGAIVIVSLVGWYVAAAISRNNIMQLDRRLQTASDVVVPRAQTFEVFLGSLSRSEAFAITIRQADTVRASTQPELPDLTLGSSTADVDGTPFRVYTAVVPDRQDAEVSIGVPLSEAQDITDDQQRQVLQAGALAVSASTVLGWIFGGRAVRPLMRLTRDVAKDPPTPPRKSTGVREADALAAAVGDMLQRVSDAQERTESALETARDFAAVSAHELRTPLTAMRTDIEVLRTLDLSEDQRREILGDLHRTQGRVESTLAALERLATGELTSAADRVSIDVVEVADLVARDAERTMPSLHVRVEAAGPVTALGHPTGLRLALDNAVLNAVRHGEATSVVITVERLQDGSSRIIVDDNGTGVPEDERERVFGRFERGTRAAAGGSGLGLALVAQQAHLHGGTVRLESSPLGGARLVLEVR
ncbi:sensor histidine kinase [Rhodococcus sp. MEB064]|uniref:sensor histidine kinase n=1 Tax=Rhodococcus sp. MEB064 TaxID=1587522 RepID=UPI0005ABCFA0|nr:HAMP domain-containing sensor histidine kinase [Rhodococcus sp. MEB064]KIQ13793.1 ATPase [Rhodococcus sp. MEB064]